MGGENNNNNNKQTKIKVPLNIIYSPKSMSIPVFLKHRK